MRKKKILIDHAFQLDLFADLFDEKEIETLSEVTDEVLIIEEDDSFVFEHGSKESVWKQFKWLREHQAIDCATIENRFFRDKEKGIQVTNGTGVGKAQPLHANILTPNGWVKMGDVKKGDFVISREGKPVKVLEVYPQGKREIFRVNLSDGSFAECCKEHLWETQTLYERRKSSQNPNWNCAKPKVRSLEEISNTIDKRHFLPIVEPINFSKKDYNIDPYLLGILLGDGGLSASNIIISSADIEIIERCENSLKDGFLIKHIANYDYVLKYHTKNEKTHIKAFYHNELRRLNLKGTKSNNKFIPKEYLLGSIEQRLDLLKGLLDTDGYVNHYKSAEYCTVSKQLALDVRDLVNSLGGICTISEKNTKGQLAYNLLLNLPEGINPFYVSRKKNSFKKKHKYLPKRIITSIESVGEFEAQCILVDDPSHLYVTDNYILTHNTFLGLALANRFIYYGKKNILIVAPTDKKVDDWCNDNNSKFDSDLRQIKTTTSIPLLDDGQPGMVATTYSNFYQNEMLNEYIWDLIIYDESHKLMENGQKKETVYLDRHRQIARLPNQFKREFVIDNFDYVQNLSLEEREKLLFKHTDRTKVLFLSASPFAYHHNLIIGDGCLWNIDQSYRMDTIEEMKGYGSYSSGPSQSDKFFMENLGYRYRYGKLTIPESGVDMPLMERMFFERQLKLGSIIGRQIQVDKDYSREFITLDSKIGQKIDEGFSILTSNEFKNEFPILHDVAYYRINYLYKNQLLESLKASLIHTRIDKHLELGRKIVIFHDFNNTQIKHPFRFGTMNSNYIEEGKTKEDYLKEQGFNHNYFEEIDFDNDFIYRFNIEVSKFNLIYKHLVQMDIESHLSNVVQEVQTRYGKRAVFFNGSIPKKKRSKNKDDFQDDLSGIDIIVVQRQAGKEGIDLHDKTGVYQRVMMDLGLPRRPTDCIQGEGRIYRDGVQSNAIWEYTTIQTIFERNTFANDISVRASTAENFAMGNKARNLKSAFKEGYLNSTENEPSKEQGFNGKEYDFKLNTMSEFETSIALYYTNQKRNSKTKSLEGEDYFATPEPLGYKIVEWLDIRPNESVLEPSCGHGAIARFFPGTSTNYIVEPSRELISKARLNIDNVKPEYFFEETFETFGDSFKADNIGMNPPFGSAGKKACQHLELALLKHFYFYLNNPTRKGRCIAILPDTTYVNKYLKKLFSEEFFEEINKEDSYLRSRKRELFKRIKLSYEVLLPSCTFNRAGTSVLCKIVVIDLINNFNQDKYLRSYDFRDIEKVEKLFEEIENLHLPTYMPYKEEL